MLSLSNFLLTRKEKKRCPGDLICTSISCCANTGLKLQTKVEYARLMFSDGLARGVRTQTQKIAPFFVASSIQAHLSLFLCPFQFSLHEF
jgi:hypothetical protein